MLASLRTILFIYDIILLSCHLTIHDRSLTIFTVLKWNLFYRSHVHLILGCYSVHVIVAVMSTPLLSGNFLQLHEYVM